MASLTSAINVQVDAKDKEQATTILKDLGLNMSTAISMFLKQIIKTDGIPFEVKNPKPSKELKQALREADDIIKNPNKYKSYHNVDEMMKDILDED